jgi:hypothetical protein
MATVIKGQYAPQTYKINGQSVSKEEFEARKAYEQRMHGKGVTQAHPSEDQQYLIKTDKGQFIGSKGFTEKLQQVQKDYPKGYKEIGKPNWKGQVLVEDISGKQYIKETVKTYGEPRQIGFFQIRGKETGTEEVFTPYEPTAPVKLGGGGAGTTTFGDIPEVRAWFQRRKEDILGAKKGKQPYYAVYKELPTGDQEFKGYDILQPAQTWIAIGTLGTDVKSAEPVRLSKEAKVGVEIESQSRFVKPEDIEIRRFEKQFAREELYPFKIEGGKLIFSKIDTYPFIKSGKKTTYYPPQSYEVIETGAGPKSSIFRGIQIEPIPKTTIGGIVTDIRKLNESFVTRRFQTESITRPKVFGSPELVASKGTYLADIKVFPKEVQTYSVGVSKESFRIDIRGARRIKNPEPIRFAGKDILKLAEPTKESLGFVIPKRVAPKWYEFWKPVQKTRPIWKEWPQKINLKQSKISIPRTRGRALSVQLTKPKIDTEFRTRAAPLAEKTRLEFETHIEQKLRYKQTVIPRQALAGVLSLKQRQINFRTTKVRITQIPKFKVALMQRTELLPRTETFASFSVPPFAPAIETPTVPFFALPDIRGGLFEGGRRMPMKISGKQKYRYTPSLAAQVLKIKAPKIPKRITGLEIRPMVR